MIDNIIQWFNAFPSRKYALMGYVLLIIYALFITHIKVNISLDRQLSSKHKRNRRFVYCNGKKSKIEYVEMVSQYEFDNYYKLIPHPVIDMNNTSIYFDKNVLCDEYYDL